MFKENKSEKSIILRTFNTQIIQFLDDINSVIRQDEIIQSKKYLESIKSLNPSLIIKIWYAHIEVPYHEQIQHKNIQFFLEKDYSIDLNKLPNSDTIIKTINSSIREPLKQMDEEDLKHCKSYIKLLSELSKRYSDL